jgi:DNA-binding CsgD family transcriptional regulator
VYVTSSRPVRLASADVHLLQRARSAVVSASLGEEFLPYVTWLERRGLRCLLTADTNRAMRETATVVALLPAFTELHSQRMGTLISAHPSVAVVGVVTDMTGHSTHRAMQHGAQWVLNLLLPEQFRLNVLGAVAELYASPVAASSMDGIAGCPQEDDEQLIRLLIGSATVAEIAQQLFCSERSLYRRLRLLYASRGVRGRRELRSLAGRMRLADGERGQ